MSNYMPNLSPEEALVLIVASLAFLAVMIVGIIIHARRRNRDNEV